MPSATTIDNFFGLMQRQLSTAARNNPPTPERLAQSEEKAREMSNSVIPKLKRRRKDWQN